MPKNTSRQEVSKALVSTALEQTQSSFLEQTQGSFLVLGPRLCASAATTAAAAAKTLARRLCTPLRLDLTTTSHTFHA
jgi:hypothetical protein